MFQILTFDYQNICQIMLIFILSMHLVRDFLAYPIGLNSIYVCTMPMDYRLETK